MEDSNPSSEFDASSLNICAESEKTTLATARQQLWPAFASVLLLTLIAGGVFPLVLLTLARLLFPSQAMGSLVTRDTVVIGSDLIGQSFNSPAYFHPRPSAAGAGYDGASSGGTNLGPTNPKLKDGAVDDPKTADVDESFAGIRQLAETYRKQNGLTPEVAVPIDAITRSGSGLDPDISPANAALQIARVSRVRGVDAEVIGRLVARHTKGRQFGFMGEPRVAVLALNLDLDRAAPLPRRAEPR